MFWFVRRLIHQLRTEAEEDPVHALMEGGMVALLLTCAGFIVVVLIVVALQLVLWLLTGSAVAPGSPAA